MSLPSHSLTEIFGHAPDDDSSHARMLWNTGTCPFLSSTCTKIDHENENITGSCTAQTPKYPDVIICPKRLYAANNYAAFKYVAQDAFGTMPFLFFDDYQKQRAKYHGGKVVVAIGQGHGKEITVGGQESRRSMDWVLAVCDNGKLEQYCGIEVQSIDITNNYKDNWAFFEAKKYKNPGAVAPPSKHGFNWANVLKRLAPQIASKGVLYSQSNLVKRGMYFILPEAVYKHFEAKLGVLETTAARNNQTLTIHTYEVGQHVPKGSIRSLSLVREIAVELNDFCSALASGGVLPPAVDLDNKVRKSLGLS